MLCWPCQPPKVPNSRTWVSQLLCLTPQRGRCSLSSVGSARLKKRVFRPSFKGLASALVTAAAAFGYRSSDLLPYSLRRGGATFHFARFGSFDLTTHCGRWALATTARKYISQAVCDASALSLPVECRRRARRCAALLSHLALDLQVQCPQNLPSLLVARLSWCLPFSSAVLRCLCSFVFSGLCSPSPFLHFFLASLLVFPVPYLCTGVVFTICGAAGHMNVTTRTHPTLGSPQG